MLCDESINTIYIPVSLKNFERCSSQLHTELSRRLPLLHHGILLGNLAWNIHGLASSQVNMISLRAILAARIFLVRRREGNCRTKRTRAGLWRGPWGLLGLCPRWTRMRRHLKRLFAELRNLGLLRRHL